MRVLTLRTNDAIGAGWDSARRLSVIEKREVSHLMQSDTYADRYLSGRELWGDDFTAAQTSQWFSDEREAYAQLCEPCASKDTYGYHGINRFHGFRQLPPRRFSHALGIGSSFGGEFFPLLDSIDRITILEPSARLRSTSLRDVPLEYVDPTPAGAFPLDTGTFDLVLCLGVLHHIPNVTYVLSEIGRVMAPGGWALIREPVISMGDWRYPRKPGITKRERGIPRGILETAVNKAGMSIQSSAFCISPFTSRIGKAVHRNLYASLFGAALDRALAFMTAWNYRYHANCAWQKIRPSSVYIVAKRDAPGGFCDHVIRSPKGNDEGVAT
jgi:SAM-dependent methyltransferase